jgi:hypothetical protein
MGLFNLFKPAATVLVVDVVALHESLGMKGNVAPRNQLQTLRRLARFSQREKVTVVAVASGSPLNKAPAGKKFEGIVVLYSASMEEHAQFMAKTVRSKGSGAVLISGNDSAEKLLGSSAKKMRISTFRKAFDSGNDAPEQQERNGSGRGNRPPRRNKQKQSQQAQQGESRPPRQPKQSKPKAASQADAINELIDLVD